MRKEHHTVYVSSLEEVSTVTTYFKGYVGMGTVIAL